MGSQITTVTHTHNGGNDTECILQFCGNVFTKKGHFSIAETPEILNQQHPNYGNDDMLLFSIVKYFSI